MRDLAFGLFHASRITVLKFSVLAFAVRPLISPFLKFMIETAIELFEGIADQLRIHSIEATAAAGSGHPTSCCSAADLAAALFFGHMKYDAKNPHRSEERRVGQR